MAYTKRIVCLANSYKKHGTCVAGRELTAKVYGPWIRPVSARPTGEISRLESYYQHYGTPKLLDSLDIVFLSPAPHNHQVENHLIDPHAKWVKSGELSPSELPKLSQLPSTLWANEDHTSQGQCDCVQPEHTSSLPCSLFLIHSRDLQLEICDQPYSGLRQYRGCFCYRGTRYSLSVTDPAVRNRFDLCPQGIYGLSSNETNTFLCISLTAPFQDGRCHKIIAAILSHPLSGAGIA